jgi:hypothetical protein
MSMKGPDGRVASETLRESLVNPQPGDKAVEGWARLLPAAANWIRHHIRGLSSRQGSVDTPAWRAQAMARAGEYWRSKRDWARATTCYTRAIQADPSLLSSYDALAVVEIYNRQYAAAAARLEHLLDLLSEMGDGARDEWPTLEESAWYHLILARVYAGLT